MTKCKLLFITANYFIVNCFVTKVAEILMLVEVQTILMMLSDYQHHTKSEKTGIFQVGVVHIYISYII